MIELAPSPLREAVASLRTGLLQTWVHDSIEAYSQAALLLGHPGEIQRLRQSSVGLLHTRMLEPAYEALLDVHAARVGEGRQLILPWERHEDFLQRQWCRVAFGFVRNSGRARVQRWVLQASVGLSGPVDRQTAAELLTAAAVEYEH